MKILSLDSTAIVSTVAITENEKSVTGLLTAMQNMMSK